MSANIIQSNIQFSDLWNHREDHKMFSIINIKYMDNSIKVQEFILKKYFGDYNILKKDLKDKKTDKIKNLHFSSSIISDDYYLEYKYFGLIIKYFYGQECNLTDISLNDLFKIHAFLTKHCIKNSDLVDKIENKINDVICDLPIINIYGGKNNCAYKITCKLETTGGCY